MYGINAVPRLQCVLERIPALQSLSLRGCLLQPGLLRLARFPLLRQLWLDDVDGLSDLWLLLCGRLPRLEVRQYTAAQQIWDSHGPHIMQRLHALQAL